MSKENAVVAVNPNSNLPDFMKSADPNKGRELLQEFVVPPRIKVMQTNSENAETYPAGTVLLSATKNIIAGKEAGEDGDPFLIVPVFFYPEYCIWSPLALKGQVPMILDRSTDPTSDIAKRAKSKELREAKYTVEKHGEIDVRYVEHLNFLCAIYGDHPLRDTVCIMSFSRGEWGAGSRFTNMLDQRKAPPFGCVFQAQVSAKKRTNAKGSWYGIDISNPPENISPWVTAQEYADYEAIYDGLAAKHKLGLIKADHEDPEDETAPDTSIDEAAQY